MVKLVAVCREEEEHEFQKRQLPLIVDKNLTLVMEFDEYTRSNHKRSDAAIDLKTFIKNYNILGEDEIKQACTMNIKDLSTFVSHMVPCVGCRRSVEQMFHQLSEMGHAALDPLIVTSRGSMSIKNSVSSNATSLYKLFYQDINQMFSLVENILKNKKNKRCFVHSLEMQKPRLGRALAMSPNNGQACTNLSSLPPSPPASNTPSVTPYYGSGSWMDIWNDLSTECKEEVVILDCEGILDLMEDYLKRHRFCKDCKNKVARAFGILVDEIDPQKEPSYCSALYVGLRFCGPKSKRSMDREAEEERIKKEEEQRREVEKKKAERKGDRNIQIKKQTVDKSTETSIGSVFGDQSRHIHVCCETNYIAHLMTRAEAEISGGRRERHAKTIDVAQEEVLTCVSLYLYERLHKLWQKVRAENQTWRILFVVGVKTIRRVFEISIENKIGMGRLEALCEELEQAERSKEMKQEKKREKKKRQKKRKEEQRRMEEVIPINTNRGKTVKVEKSEKGNGCDHGNNICVNSNMSPCPRNKGNSGPGFYQGCDLGYSSGQCESSVSSREGSDVTCSDGFCNHETDDHDCDNQTSVPLKSKTSSNSARKGCRPCDISSAPPISTVAMEGSCDGCQSSQDGGKKGRKEKRTTAPLHKGQRVEGHPKEESKNFQSRLLEMLQEEPSSLFSSFSNDTSDNTASERTDLDENGGSDTEGLTAEEIAEFELNRSRIREERIVLREKIRKNFEHFCGNRGDETVGNGDVSSHGYKDGGTGTVANGNGRPRNKTKSSKGVAQGKKSRSRK